MTEDGKQRLEAGVAREHAVPPLGMRLAGSLRDGISKSVHEPLAVTSLFLREGDLSVVIITCDLILMPPEDALEFREAVATALSIPAAQVMLSFSHSHATPSPVSWGEHDYEATSEEKEAVERFFDELKEKTVLSATKARDCAVPSRVASATGESDINVNRRERRSDGAMLLGRNPEGPADKEVGVLRIDTERGDPLTMVFNYACHPDVLGPKSSLVSPDFVGPARKAVEAVTGTTAIYMQGAAGDIYPCTGIVNGDAGVRVATQLGRRLGSEAARVFECIDTFQEPDERLEWVSTNSITTNWNYRERALPEGSQLAISRVVLEMPTRPLPTEEEAAALVESRRKELTEIPSDAPLSSRLIANRRLAWANVQLEAVRSSLPPVLPVEMQAIRIGDAVLIAIPGELFTEIGLKIKEKSPFRHTFVCAYTNGVYFYIPTKAAFEEGGYEVNSHQNYMRAAGPTSDWEEILVDKAAELLGSIAQPDNVF